MGEDPVHILWFDRVGLGCEAEVGGKCASLGELTILGLNVPPGFAVTTQACAELFAGVDLVLDNVDPKNTEQLASAAEAIQRRIMAHEPSAALRASIAGAYRQLEARVGRQGLSVAVRSSAVAEDRAGASFAGQLDTCLGVLGEQEVLDALRRCVASLYTARAIRYRAEMGLDHAATAIGVAVQQMVHASAAGVLFTQDAVNGDPSVMSLESTVGLGEPVVSGEVTPDHFLISKLTGAVVRRRTSNKEVALCFDARSGRCVRTLLPADQQRSPSLDDDEIARLVDAGRRIEQHYGCPMDIEWAIIRNAPHGHEPFIVQARPVTLAPCNAAPQARGVLEGIVGTLCRGRSTSRLTSRREP